MQGGGGGGSSSRGTGGWWGPLCPDYRLTPLQRELAGGVGG